MSTGQEWNNRSQGQSIRRLNEKLVEFMAKQAEINAQNARDFAMTKARVSALEKAFSQVRRLVGLRP